MGSAALDIKSFKGLTQDSRRVKPGYLFAALPGSKLDGREYIADAIHNGAGFVLVPTGTSLPEGVDMSGVELITDDNPRRRLALMAAEFYGAQPDHIVAVTGTNGKTSIVHFVQQLWEALDLKAASLGTLGLHGADFNCAGSFTTPDPVVLHENLAELSGAGVPHLVMEASSHGLHQYRIDGVKVKVAGFTNLSRDHLDYHKNMDDYFAAKARLFSEILQPGGTAILNADDERFTPLCSILHSSKGGGGGTGILSYGHEGKDLKMVSVKPTTSGQSVSLEIMGKIYDLTLPLVGEFQVMNALCALGLVIAEDRDDTPRTEKLVAALGQLEGAPGRLQLVEGHPQDAGIYVDYAHTPDALENVLKALRPHTQGRLICVFGCGGDRDTGKRPLMGKIASEHADLVIVTDDNPRSEDPAQIRREIMAGAKGASEIGGRREAIEIAAGQLQKGDVLLLAGKGHEQGQVFADHTEEFDDVQEVKKAIEAL